MMAVAVAGAVAGAAEPALARMVPTMVESCVQVCVAIVNVRLRWGKVRLGTKTRWLREDGREEKT